MKTNGIDKFSQMGVAAMIPGMQHMIELMQTELNRMRSLLDAAQNGVAIEARGPGERKSGWPADPLERSKEMARRMGVAAARREAGETRSAKSTKIKGMHPRDPNHPGHDAWLGKLRKAQKRYWGGLSVKGQKAKIAKMLAGRASNASEALVQ